MMYILYLFAVVADILYMGLCEDIGDVVTIGRLLCIG